MVASPRTQYGAGRERRSHTSRRGLQRAKFAAAMALRSSGG